MANPFKSHPRVKNTDGRSPTTTHQGGASKKEGNTSLGISGGGHLGKNPGMPKVGRVERKGLNAPNPDEGAIEKMINRNASSFRRDIVARSNKKKQPRGRGYCD
jgi:hypothetical protein